MYLKRGRRKTEPAAPHTERECMDVVRFMYATEEIRRDVFNALRRTGLSKNAAFDAMHEMERSYLVFGKIYGAREFGERSEQLTTSGNVQEAWPTIAKRTAISTSQ